MKFNALILLAFLPLFAPAQTRTVMANTSGGLVAPGNFYEANPVVSSGGPVLREFVSVESILIPRGVPELSSSATTEDRVVLTVTYDNKISDYQLSPGVLRDMEGAGLTWSSDTPARATVSAGGFVTHVSNGDAVLRASVGGFSRAVPLSMSTEFEGTATFITGGAAGSLREHMTWPIDEALELGPNKEMFSTAIPATQTYIRNGAFFGYQATIGLGAWTALPVWNSYTPTLAGIRRHGIAIAPDLVVFATHYPLEIGTVIRWLDSAGAVVERTVIDRRMAIGPDLSIGLLSSALPGTVVPLKVFQFVDYKVTLYYQEVPVISTNQHHQGSVRDIQGNGFWWFTPPRLAPRLATYHNMISGDSGGPALAVIDGELVLMGLWWYSNFTPPIGSVANVAAINAAAAAMGSASTATVFDVSTYPNFGAPPAP